MQKPYTIGITGGSGSGKTYFVHTLLTRFKKDEVCFISQDHYYKQRHLQASDAHGVQNFDLPTAIERELFHQDIVKIKNGQIIRKNEYAFNNPNAQSKEIEFRPAPLLIIEGLFVQFFEEISQELDLKIFIEAKDYIKLSRRITRDNDERGYGLDDVLYRYQNHVMPTYEALIQPLKYHADLIIPNNQDFSRALDMLTLGLKTKIQGGIY